MTIQIAYNAQRLWDSLLNSIYVVHAVFMFVFLCSGGLKIDGVDPDGQPDRLFVPWYEGVPRPRNDPTTGLHQVGRRLGLRRHHLRIVMRLPTLRRRLSADTEQSRPTAQVHVAFPPMGEGPFTEREGPIESLVEHR